MRLNYRILWVEDSIDWAESIKDSLIEIVETYGLFADFSIIPAESDEQDYNGYNLILMDLGLAEGKQGDALIKQIRELNVFTYIVFYSASGVKTVKDMGRELDLEGVFYADRSNHLFLRKVKDVICASLQSFQDLVNLRGLVMAEVSELDAKMDLIIGRYFTQKDRIEEFHKHVTHDKEQSTKRNLEGDCKKSCQLKWRKMDMPSILKSIESNSRAHALHVIISHLESTGVDLHSGESFYQQYDKDIIKTRNQLAHCVESRDDNGRPILRTRNEDIFYTEESIIEIRKKIKSYNQLFERINNELN